MDFNNVPDFAINPLLLCVHFDITGNAGNAPLAPVAIGFSLMVGIFALGHVSGAHFNPAVTLGVWIRGKIDPIGAGSMSLRNWLPPSLLLVL